MNKQNVMNTLKEVDIIQVDVRQYGGKKTLDDSEVIPDVEKVSTKGQKWVVDSDNLKGFSRLRGEYRRICLRFGTLFMGGFAVPKTKSPDVLKELTRLQNEWDELVANFVTGYPTMVEDWARAKPAWAASIRKDAPSPEKVKKSFRFSFQAFEINPSTASNAGNLVKEELDSLALQVCKEVAQDMRDNFDGSKGFVSQRVRRVIQRARDKYAAFAFLDPALDGAVKAIDTALVTLPTTGPIKDAPFLMLSGLVALLSQPEKVLGGLLTTVIPDGPDDAALAAPVSAVLNQDTLPLSSPESAHSAVSEAPAVVSPAVAAPVLSPSPAAPVAVMAPASPAMDFSW